MMRKRYLLLTGLILGSSMVFGQSLNLTNKAVQEEKRFTKAKVPQQQTKQNFEEKVYGDTLYYEPFDTDLNGWTVGNNTGNSNDWVWDTDAPGGQYTGEPAIASTSGPGFLSMRMDFYNTPTPPGGSKAMDAWVTSPAIAITPKKAVYLHFEQYQRYNNQGTNNTMVVEVSTDSLSWTAFDTKEGRGPNDISDNPEKLKINVSEQLANQDSVYIRFRIEGPQRYFWMVDDVTLIEGPRNAMELSGFNANYFSNTAFFAPNYGSTPLTQVSDVTYDVRTINNGSEIQTGVKVSAKVFQDSLLDGTSGSGQVYSEDSTVSGIVLPNQKDTTSILTPFVATGTGYYSHHISVSSDSANEFGAEMYNESYSFRITDSTYALDHGSLRGWAGPAGYVEGRGDGDQVAQLFLIKNETYATSISLPIPPIGDVEEVKFKPVIYAFEEDSILIPDTLTLTTLNAAISDQNLYTNPLSIEIDTNTMGGRFTTFKLDPPVKLQPGAYYVGVEQTSGQSNSRGLFFYEDQTAKKRSTDITTAISTIMYLANSTSPGAPRWSSMSTVLGIRLNVNKTIGLSENGENSNTEFAVLPNPTDGEFKLQLESDEAVDYTLNIHNMIGQVIHTEELSVNGKLTKEMNLDGYEKGVYFVSLVNDNERLVKKVVLK